MEQWHSRWEEEKEKAYKESEEDKKTAVQRQKENVRLLYRAGYAER